jgi:hypothetical protein
VAPVSVARSFDWHAAMLARERSSISAHYGAAETTRNRRSTFGSQWILLSRRETYVGQAQARLRAPRPPSERREARERFGGLTAQERDVAALIARGLSGMVTRTWGCTWSERESQGRV